MHYRSIIACMVSVATAANAVAQQTHDLRHSLSDVENHEWTVYANPALMEARHKTSFADAAVTFAHDSGDKAVTAQTGRAFNDASFAASSYQRLGKESAVWGKAAYHRRQTKGVEWNETSDFMEVYPYVIADTVGGKMQRESYLFNIGYAQSRRHLSYGMEAEYQSAVEYRDIDPRPKNNTIYAVFKAGVSVDISDSHQTGAFIGWRHYSQQQNITFMNPYGKIMLYQMSGLAMQYHRFAGTLGDANYTGNTWFGGLTLHPTNGNGVEAQLNIARRSMQKQLSGLNNAPINDIAEWTYGGEAAMRREKGYTRLQVAYADRRGTERIYDDGVHNYHQISATQPFRATTLCGTAEAARQWTWGKWTMETTATVDVVSHKQTYTSPARELSFTNLNPKIGLLAMWQTRNNLLTMRLSETRQQNICRKLSIDEPGLFDKPLKALYDNYDMITAGAWTTSVSARYDIAMPRVVSTLYVCANANYTALTGRHHRQGIDVSLGVTL